MCFARSHNQQRLLFYTVLADWFCITEVESVYCAVRTESLYKIDTFVFKGLSKMNSSCTRARQEGIWRMEVEIRTFLIRRWMASESSASRCGR